MKAKHFIKIEIVCNKADDINTAKEIVNYHLESLNPQFNQSKNRLTAKVEPLNPKLFYPQEGLKIIRQTLAPSISMIGELKCTLHTIN